MQPSDGRQDREARKGCLARWPLGVCKQLSHLPVLRDESAPVATRRDAACATRCARLQQTFLLTFKPLRTSLCSYPID